MSFEEAKKRALRMLEKRDYGRDELVGKLTEKGEAPEDAEAAADRMVELGLINDERYAGLVARHYAQKGYGASRIKNELYKRRIPKDYWDEALSSLPDSGDTLCRLLQSKLRGADLSDRAAVKKATDAMSRRGYSWSEITSALERLREE
jgi:regulatory protein